MTPTPCAPCCVTPQIVNVPGLDSTVPGPNLVDGTTATTLNGILTGDGSVVGAVANPLPIADGGTGAATQAAALTAILGASIIPNANLPAPAATTNAKFSIAGPLTVTSAVPLMLGIGGTAQITPTKSGVVLVILTAVISKLNGATGANAQLYFGSGAAPGLGAAATGTTLGSVKTVDSTDTTNDTYGIALSFIATGLTLATAYWFDVAMSTGAGVATSLSGIDVVLIEL